MAQIDAILGKCKDIRVNQSLFKKYNNPARILALIAIIVPLAITYPTSELGDDGNQDLTTSPYAIPAGIIFLGGAIIAYILSKKASEYKIRPHQNWVINTLEVYENLTEYERTDTLEHYKEKATEHLDDLIESIKDTINQTDDKIQWIIPFVNPIDDVIEVVENDILPIVESGDKTKIPKVKTYLLNLMSYFLSPSQTLLDKLLVENDNKIENSFEVTKTINNPLPFRNIGIFGVFASVGVMVYLLAMGLEIDKNYAFTAAVGIAGALSAGYFVYMKKN